MSRDRWRSIAWAIGLDYPINVALFLAGFFRLGRIKYREGWGPLSFLLRLYWWDYGINVVILAGQVESISRHAQDHRSGWLWDKLLDAIERFDRDHGPRSGPPLWGSVLPPVWVRIVVPLAWVGAGVWWLW